MVAVSLDTSDHTYFNGVEQTYTAQGTSVAHATTATAGYNIGSEGASASFPNAYSGSVSYAVFYPTVLTKSQIASESSYINAKVNARQGVPVYPLYSTSTTPQVNIIGDSLSAGADSTAPWANLTYITPLNNTYVVNNFGWAWDEASNVVGNLQAKIAGGISPQAGRNICHVWLGTNDFGDGAYNAPAIWSSLQQIGLSLQRMGCTPILASMISRVATGNNGVLNDTNKNTLNALERANWRNAFAGFDDLAAIPGLGADGAYANPTFTCFNQTDKIHLNNVGAGTCFNSLAGYGVVGAQVAKVINILDGNTVSTPTLTATNTYVQLIGDNFVTQTPTAAGTDQLIDCTGLTGIQRVINNASGSFGITVTTTTSQTITGSASIPANSSGTFTCQLTGPTTGGNYWQRTN